MKTLSWNNFGSFSETSRSAVLLAILSLFTFAGTALSQKMGPSVSDGYRIGKSDEDMLKVREKLESANGVNQAVNTSMTAPSNDSFANAIPLSGSGGFTYTNVGATAEPGEPAHGGGNGASSPSQNNSIWFKFVPQSAGVVRFWTSEGGDPNGALTDTVISVYAGSSVSSLSVIAESDDTVSSLYSQVTFGFQPGITYYIAVDGYLGLTGTFSLSRTVYLAAPNDDFNNAEDLGGDPKSPFIGITGSSSGAAGQSGEPDHNGNALPFNSIWYKWTPNVAGTYTFDTQGSEFDTILAVYKSNAGAPGQSMGSSDDFGNTGVRTSRVTFYADAGQTYLIAIDSFSDWWGNTLLNWSPYREESGKKFDFDGDSRTDISIFRPSNGQWWIKRSSGGHFALTFGNVSDEQTPADFTGDGKIDIAFWRPSTGFWYILRSDDNSFYAFPFGTAGDIPVTGRFDNDAKADTVVYRPSTGVWYINRSRTSSSSFTSFGLSGDVPVPADYDGDGITDIGIFRPSNGQWWINRSRAGLAVATFGTSTDLPVPGAYSGHGYANVAFWRPSTGEWFVLVNPSTPSYYSFPFGISTDLPAPGDYDGDGKFDAAVFRPSNATWYINRTNGSGTLIDQFGAAGDRPVPGSFIP